MSLFRCCFFAESFCLPPFRFTSAISSKSSGGNATCQKTKKNQKRIEKQKRIEAFPVAGTPPAKKHKEIKFKRKAYTTCIRYPTVKCIHHVS